MSQTDVARPPATSDTAAIGIVSSASYVAMLVGVVRSVVLARVLGPVGRGVFRGVGLVAQYATHCNIGLVHGMNKLMPLWLGRGDREAAERLQNTAFTGTLALTSVTVSGILALAFAAPMRIAWETRLGLALGAALLLMSQASLLATSLLRTYGDYTLLGQSRIVSCIGQFAAAVGFGMLWGPAGAVLGLVVGDLLGYLWILRGTRVHISARLKRHELKLLISTGLPLLLLALADQFYRTADGLVLLKVRHAAALGLYDIGLRMAAFLFNIPGSVSYVLFPRFLETYGRDEDPAALRRLLFAPTIALVAMLPLLAGAGFLLIGPFITGFLPRFLPGLPAVRVLIMGGILLGIPAASDSFLIAIGRHRRVIVHKLVGGSLIATAAFLFARSSLPMTPMLTRVAGAACVGYATASGLSLGLAFSHFREHRPVWLLGRPLLLAAYSVALTLAAHWLSRQIPGPDDTWLKAIIALIVLTIGSLPVLKYAEREARLLTRLRDIVLRRRR